MTKFFITAEEAKENVRLYSLDIFHTAIKIYSDREDNYEDLLEEIYWAVRKESYLGHSMISILVKASASVKEAIDIYKIAKLLEGQGFVAYVSGSIDSNQVELVVMWGTERLI